MSIEEQEKVAAISQRNGMLDRQPVGPEAQAAVQPTPRLVVILNESTLNHEMANSLLNQLREITCSLYGPEPEKTQEGLKACGDGVIDALDKANGDLSATLNEALAVLSRINNIV